MASTLGIASAEKKAGIVRELSQTLAARLDSVYNINMRLRDLRYRLMGQEDAGNKIDGGVDAPEPVRSEIENLAHGLDATLRRALDETLAEVSLLERL